MVLVLNVFFTISQASMSNYDEWQYK